MGAAAREDPEGSTRRPGWLAPWRALERIEPTLGPLEGAYRRAVLREDIAQMTAGSLVFVAPHVFFIRSDYVLFGWSLAFAGMAALRVGTVLFTLLTVWLLRRVDEPADYERLALAWGLLGAAALTVTNFTRPPTYTHHLLVDVLALLVGYLMIPNRLIYRALPSLAFTLSLIVLYLTRKELTDPLAWNAFWASLLMANLFGVVLSGRMHTYRRRQFLARHELERARDALHVLAMTDPLTGLLNRRSFMELADAEVARARRNGRPLAMIAVDLDHFKDVNDRFGHAAGDAALRQLAAVLGALVKGRGAVGRLGGEEFAVVLPGAALDEARDVGELVRRGIGGHPTEAGGVSLRLTASLGVAELGAEDATAADTLTRADRALYRAKDAGRDRVAAA